MTRPQTQYWSVLRWKFDVGCDSWAQCWVQRFKVQAAHPGGRILKRKSPGEEGMPKGLEIWLFEGVKVDEIAWNFRGPIPAPQAQHFHRVLFPGCPGAMHKYAKTLCRGWGVGRFGETTKRERQGDTLTCKQNASTTTTSADVRSSETMQSRMLLAVVNVALTP